MIIVLSVRRRKEKKNSTYDHQTLCTFVRWARQPLDIIVHGKSTAFTNNQPSTEVQPATQALSTRELVTLH